MARGIVAVQVERGEAARPAAVPRIGVEVADPALADALLAHIQARIGAATGEIALPDLRVVKDDDTSNVPGALVLICVGGRSPAELLAHVLALEAAAAAGLQLVWSGRPRRAERAVFCVLEAWRGAQHRCPLLLAPDEAPLPLLLRAIARSGSLADAAVTL